MEEIAGFIASYSFIVFDFILWEFGLPLSMFLWDSYDKWFFHRVTAFNVLYSVKLGFGNALGTAMLLYQFYDI